ncbi:MAG: hypothetical protein K8T26_17785 [Lentisphaerae bacterium]|nr:hypothetical protein [Lentisphaerota bacterium]
MVLHDLLVWVHVLCMLGTFGGLLVIQFGLPREWRDSAAGARVGTGLIYTLLGVGFVVGLGLLGWQMHAAGTAALGGHYWGVIGLKFILLLVVGAMLGIATRKLRAGLVGAAVTLRGVAIGALALAALLGVTLPG